VSGILALVGGGEWSEGCTFDRELIDATGTTEVAVLPTGSAFERPQLLIHQAENWFGPLGITVRAVPVLNRRDAFDGDYAATLRAARFIYIAGASPMHLRSVLKDTPVFEAVLASWEAGGVLAGTNAGADVLCDPMVDSRGGAFTVGLGVVRQFAAIPRVDEWSHEKVRRTVELAPSGVSLVGIPRRTALLRDPDGRWSHEGAGEVSVYVDGQPADPSDLVA
jgi:cyanophycinase